jgi:2-phospho-L-lactate guanylyltransferase
MWVVIPVKDLNSSKSRMAHALPAYARPALMSALLADLFVTLKNCIHVTGVAIISRCPKAGALAQDLGLEVLSLDKDRCLNSGVCAAVTELTSRAITDMMILHGDLPLVESADIDDLIAAHRQSGHAVTLVPDNHNNGTNAMLLTLPTAMQFHYGQHSYQQHRMHCLDNTIRVQTVINQHIGCDIDVWPDFQPLLSLRTTGQRPQLARWLEQYGDLFDWPLVSNH